MGKKKILLFGGTFNPIHNGHLIVARYMAEKLEIGRVSFVPNGLPPHKDKVVSKEHRLEMLKIAMLNDLGFYYSSYELQKLTPSYAIETVRHYKEVHQDRIDKPYWMIGPDNIDDIKNWHKIDELKKECVFVAGISSMTTCAFQNVHERTFEGFDIKTVIIPHIDIRSTDIRERVSKGLSIRHYVPDAVEEYIRENGLYKTN